MKSIYWDILYKFFIMGKKMMKNINTQHIPSSIKRKAVRIKKRAIPKLSVLQSKVKYIPFVPAKGKSFQDQKQRLQKYLKQAPLTYKSN